MINKAKKIIIDKILDAAFASTMVIRGKFYSLLAKVKSNQGHIFYHRHYIKLLDPKTSPLLVMEKIQKDIQLMINRNIASIEKIRGQANVLIVGDEYLLSTPAGWITPLRVMDVTNHGFTLLTLDKNFESGAIHFEITSLLNGSWKFSIESLAQSSNEISLLSDEMPLAKMEYLNLWTDCCKYFANTCQIDDLDNIPFLIINESVDDKTKEWSDSAD